MQTNPIYLLSPQKLKLFPLEIIQFHARHNAREKQTNKQKSLKLRGYSNILLS